jgi:hypothetical protein
MAYAANANALVGAVDMGTVDFATVQTGLAALALHYLPLLLFVGPCHDGRGGKGSLFGLTN